MGTMLGYTVDSDHTISVSAGLQLLSDVPISTAHHNQEGLSFFFFHIK